MLWPLLLAYRQQQTVVPLHRSALRALHMTTTQPNLTPHLPQTPGPTSLAPHQPRRLLHKQEPPSVQRSIIWINYAEQRGPAGVHRRLQPGGVLARRKIFEWLLDWLFSVCGEKTLECTWVWSLDAGACIGCARATRAWVNVLAGWLRWLRCLRACTYVQLAVCMEAGWG